MNLKALVKLVESGPLNEQQIAAINARITGMDATLGIRYTEIAKDGVSAELEIGPHMLQPFGLVNGGSYAALAESVGSFRLPRRRGPSSGAEQHYPLFTPRHQRHHSRAGPPGTPWQARANVGN